MKKVTVFVFVAILLVAGAIYLGFKQFSGQFVPPKGTVPLRISEATTIVTEPLQPDGESIDFYAVLDQLCSANADSEENGFREIVKLVGRSIFDISDGRWIIFCKKLNLNPDDPPQFHYLRLGDFLKDAVDDKSQVRQIYDALYSAFDTPKEVSTENLELLKRWSEEMEPAVSAVAEALKKPIYVIPAMGKWSDDNDFLEEYGLDEDDFDFPYFIPGILAQREILRMFSYRRSYRKLKNDTEYGAENWNDALSMFRVARHTGQQPDALETAVHLEGAAAFQATETLKTQNFDADKLRQCLADLESLPDLLNLTAYWDYQRFGWLKNISEFPRRGPVAFKLRTLPIPESPWVTEEEKEVFRQVNKQVKKVIRVYRNVPFDWNIVAEIMNAEFDELQGKQTRLTIFQSNPALRKLYDETKVPEYSLDEVLALTEGSFTKVLENSKFTAAETWKTLADEDWNVRRWQKMSIEERSVYLGKTHFASYATPSEMFAYQSRGAVLALDMLKTVIALQLYKAEQGNYPASLDALVEKGYMPEVPRDLYHKDRAALVYRIEPDGSCLLYSVGSNGIDDGGESDTSWTPGGHRRDDIAVRLK